MTAIRVMATALICLPTISVAQLLVLQPGTRVRIDARPALPSRIVGTVMSQSPDSIVVAESAPTWHRLAATSVRRVELYRGRSPSAGARRGLVLGALIFGTATFVGGRFATDDKFTWPLAATLTFISTAAGVAIGADRWTRLYPVP